MLTNAKGLINRISNTLRIIRSPYRELLMQDRGKFEKPTFLSPEIMLVSEIGDFQLLEIAGFQFYWPKKYKQSNLRSIYQEVFAPIPSNPHAYEYMNVNIKSGDWVLDAGACEGFFAKYALLRGARVLVIEPFEEFFDALMKTFQTEISENRVILIQGALGDKPGKNRLKIPKCGPISATIDPEWKLNENWDLVLPIDSDDQQEIDVRVFTIDEIMQQKLVPTIDFIKMDIENAEVDAMRGASETLRTYKPKISIATYHSYINAKMIHDQIKKIDRRYKISYRGIFNRTSFGLPRPYMLHAYTEKSFKQ